MIVKESKEEGAGIPRYHTRGETMRLLFIIILVLSCGRDGGAKKEAPCCDHVLDDPPTYPVPVEHPGETGTDVFARIEYIAFHNLKRCWHSVDSATWDVALAKEATKLAGQCLEPGIANTSAGVGKNSIAILDAWYMEFLKFPFGMDNGNAESARFSRMVWKGVVNFGCGSSQCPKGLFVVCKYDPSANVAGQYAVNVFRIKPDFLSCNGM